MSPLEFKAARQSLGLTVSQMAEMLGVHPVHVRRMEMPCDHSTTARVVTPATARLVTAYLDGYRPRDWPWNAGRKG
jgi:transcriptional regulator with XRE-family HTH domain